MSTPYDFTQARDAATRASLSQQQAETALIDATRRAAEAEERYRVALAKEIVRQHHDEKVAWTVAPDLARGDERVARLRMERDVAEGVREAMAQASWRVAADRRDTGRLIEWSARRELAEAGLPVPDGSFGSVIGGRVAA